VAKLDAIAVAAILCTACTPYPYDCLDYSECPGNSCPGECVPLAPVDFDGPFLLWVGSPADAPGCPAHAARKVYDGHADLAGGFRCPSCECLPAACAMPAGLTTSPVSCVANGQQTPYSLPPTWNGACSALDPPVIGQLGSVTIAPTSVIPCEPVVDIPQSLLGSPWIRAAFACTAEAIPGACGDSTLACVPTSKPPPPGFRQCLVYNRDDEPTCPAEFPEQQTVYGDLEDTRSCSPCTCEQTAPSECVAAVTTYADAVCSMPIATNPVDDAPSCHDVPAATTLASVSASWIVENPGACEAVGGEQVGAATPLDKRSFCCAPPRD
jgi:hypothetical protein